MQLSLSSAAVADLPLVALLAGCQRRGLSGFELVLDAHDVQTVDTEESLRTSRGCGVSLVGLLCPRPAGEHAGRAVGLAARLAVPLVLPAAEFSPVDLGELLKLAMAGDGRILLLHGTDPGAAFRLRRVVEALPPGTAGLAWQVDPKSDDRNEAPMVLQAAGPRLEYVRLLGGGPESALQTGMGVGSLMARLTLSRFSGPLVLTPSTPGYQHAWRSWLGTPGGWGCGSKQSDLSLVSIR
jgi:hypothetical protein